jgi:hypothetical protein
LSVDFDLVISMSNDPVDLDSAPGVTEHLLALASIMARFRDFDQECDVGRLRAALKVEIRIASHDGDVGARFIEVWNSGRLLFADEITFRDDPITAPAQQFCR